MSIREKLQKNPAIGLTLGLVLIVVAAVVLMKSSGSGMKLAHQAFYTVDDGQTTFTASRELQAPFDHEGKQAVKVNMYNCDGKQFIGFLSKLTDEDKKAWDAAMQKQNGKEASGPMVTSYLVKKPGAGKWVSNLSPEGGQILNITCDSGVPEIVHPEE